MYHLLILNVAREAWFQTSTCSLIVFNSFFVLYLMCCVGNNPLYMDFTPIKILFCFVLYSLHGAYNVYCQTKTCCRAWHNPYYCLHLTWNPESLSWPSICVQGVKGFDTIHTVVYTLHGAQESLHWPPVSIQGVEGFDTTHPAVYTLHGAQEPPTLIPCQYTRCWRVWNNPYCYFNKQLLFKLCYYFLTWPLTSSIYSSATQTTTIM